ncbi:MAG: hypothetical protein AAB582_00190 [Patescibacteria group bacterium]
MDSDSPIPFMREKEVVPVAETVPVIPPVMAAAPIVETPEAVPAAKGGWGGVIGIILIVGLIVTAAFYSWGERLATQTATPEVTAE